MNRWPTVNQKLQTFQMLGYKPFDAQYQIHQSGADIVQVVGGEGAGKSYITAMEVTACVPFSSLVYLIGQTYINPQIEFNYLVENLSRLGALSNQEISQPKQGSWELRAKIGKSLQGCRIVTLSVEQGASSIIAKGEQPDIFVLCEAGIIGSYSVFLASMRRATRARGRLILTGTLKDNFGWYASLVDELMIPGNQWHGETFSIPTWTNEHVYPGGEQNPLIQQLKATMPEDEYQRTIAAQRVPSRALVFPEFNYTKHVRDCPFDPSLPVYLWIDPGYYPSAYVVLAVQFHGSEVWIIDEVYLNNHIHTEVINICMAKEWWYKVARAVIDFAGRQHHAEKSAEEVWLHYGKVRCFSQFVGILDGIARHRSFLSPTSRLFHDPSCKNTLEEYRKYRRKTDKDGNTTSDEPIDRDNHSMKAIAYGLVDRFGFVDHKTQQSIYNYAQMVRQ